jgi:hypothetical protein
VARARATYLDLIDRDRDARDRAGERGAARASKVAPLAVAPGTPHRKALQRDLGRHYEACKKRNRGRLRGERLKNYCAATAWTIVEKSGRGPKPVTRKAKPMAGRKRTKSGRFMKASASRRRRKSGSESRRRRRPRAREHNVQGYTMKRQGRRVRVRPHRSAEKSRRRRTRARAPSRRRRARRQQNNIIIARSSRRRRRYYAKAPPMATAGGLVIAGLGAVVGYEVTDLGDRFIAGYSTATTPAPTLPSGVTSIAQFNDAAVGNKPGIWRVVWGLGMMVVGFGGGAMAPWAGLKMFLYGWGLGATAHLGGSLLNSYVVEPMFVTNGVPSATGSRLFQHEANAVALLNPATSTTTTTTASTTTPATATSTTTTATTTPAATPATTAGLGHLPGTMRSAAGTPIAALAPAGRGLPNMQPVARVPAALASQRRGSGSLGQSGSDFTYVPEGYVPPQTTPPNNTPPPIVPNNPPPVQQQQPPPMGPCGPCAPQPGPPQLATLCGCTGTNVCSCGQCGQPPEDRQDSYRHPLFRVMAGRDPIGPRRRAA